VFFLGQLSFGNAVTTNRNAFADSDQLYTRTNPVAAHGPSGKSKKSGIVKTTRCRKSTSGSVLWRLRFTPPALLPVDLGLGAAPWPASFQTKKPPAQGRWGIMATFS